MNELNFLSSPLLQSSRLLNECRHRLSTVFTPKIQLIISIAFAGLAAAYALLRLYGFCFSNRSLKIQDPKNAVNRPKNLGVPDEKGGALPKINEKTPPVEKIIPEKIEGKKKEEDQKLEHPLPLEEKPLEKNHPSVDGKIEEKGTKTVGEIPQNEGSGDQGIPSVGSSQADKEDENLDEEQLIDPSITYSSCNASDSNSLASSPFGQDVQIDPLEDIKQVPIELEGNVIIKNLDLEIYKKNALTTSSVSSLISGLDLSDFTKNKRPLLKKPLNFNRSIQQTTDGVNKTPKLNKEQDIINAGLKVVSDMPDITPLKDGAFSVICNGILFDSIDWTAEEILNGLFERNRKDAENQKNSQTPKGFKLNLGVLPKALTTNHQPIVSEEKKVGGHIVGSASCQGISKEMGDRVIGNECSFSIDFPCTLDFPIQIFGAVHSHKGCEAAEFIKDNLAGYVTDNLKSRWKYSGNISAVDGYMMTPGALSSAFADLHKNCPGRTGATGSFAIIFQEEIWIASFGNTRALLIKKDGTVIQASEDADPMLDYYSLKFEKLGGSIQNNKMSSPIKVKDRTINFDLSFASSIGAKAIVNDKDESFISSEPTITRFKLKDFEGGYLVLGTSGLFKKASSQEIGDAVIEMSNQNMPPKEMAERLVCSAIEWGSEKSIVAEVVYL